MSDANDRDELDATAGEYVLGTLGAQERAAAEARLATNAAFRAAVARWERHMQPLADAIEPVAPGADLFHRITAQIGSGDVVESADGVDVAALTVAVSRWRLATGIAATIAIAAVVVAIGESTVQNVNAHQYVAVLSAQSATPAFIATVKLDANTLVIRRLGEAAPTDHSYELWAIPSGQAPQPLGVLDQAEYSHDLGGLEPANLTLAVSLEPKGGSTTGAPTGPVEFTGTLIPGN